MYEVKRPPLRLAQMGSEAGVPIGPSKAAGPARQSTGRPEVKGPSLFSPSPTIQRSASKNTRCDCRFPVGQNVKPLSRRAVWARFLSMPILVTVGGAAVLFTVASPSNTAGPLSP
jgi:hypothetical protein